MTGRGYNEIPLGAGYTSVSISKMHHDGTFVNDDFSCGHHISTKLSKGEENGVDSLGTSVL